MKRLLNTLYVTTQGTYLAKDGDTVSVRVENETKLRIPVHTLDGIVCFGQVSCSPQLMYLCAENNVTMSFLSNYGKFWASVRGSVSGNVLLRRAQYRFADDEQTSASIARNIVIAKAANSKTVLMRALRDHTGAVDTDAIESSAAVLTRVLNSLQDSASLEKIRGYEGEAARVYFDVFDHLIVSQKDDFFFTERSRRPPRDNMNALLSFLYALCHHDLRSSLESVGLDPAVGYLHRDRPGRFGLALDLMEEFRPFLADRLALSLVNRAQVKAKGFVKTDSGAILMDDDTRKAVLVAFQNRKQDVINHPFLGEKISISLLPHIQAQLFARFVRGDIDGYPPYFWK